MDEQQKCFHSFSYCIKDRGKTPKYILRDQTAFAELVAFFTGRGYWYAGAFLNYPSDKPVDIDVSSLKASDLLILPTRPPLDDEEHGDIKQIIRSRTSLEEEVLGGLRDYFEVCARSHVKLSRKMAGHLPSSFVDRADIEFKQLRGPWYKSLKTYKGFPGENLKNKPLRTAAYLVHLDSLWEDGPALLASFGMSSAVTLVWNYLLRRKYAHLLESPVFAIAEISAPSPPTPTLTLDFVNDWEVKILLEHRL